MILTVKVVETPEAAIVHLAGKLALGRDSEQVENAVSAQLSAGKRNLILDFSGVDHIDSTGVGIVAFCFGRVRAGGGSLRVSGARGRVREIFSVTQLDALIPFDANDEEARARFA
jgi:anti-sigma B factor antagonist